jgi:intron-binding protein aquarius
LKRVILLGDHHQLPPVVKNRVRSFGFTFRIEYAINAIYQGFQHYGRLDQSMFVRFIRLQVPYIQLDAQGNLTRVLCRFDIKQ